MGNGKKPQKVFNEDTSIGRYIRISMSRNECLHLSEVEVFGYHTMGMPSASPTPTVVNLSLNKPAVESSTYNNAGGGAAAAVDGNDNSFTHTNCWTGINQWWEVDLGSVDQTIVSIEIVNRLDCCGGRLHDFTISFHDETKTQIDSIFNAGGIGNRKTFPVGKYRCTLFIKTLHTLFFSLIQLFISCNTHTQISSLVHAMSKSPLEIKIASSLVKSR